MSTRFVLNETSYFGKGAREELKTEIKRRGFKKVFLVKKIVCILIYFYKFCLFHV